MNWVQNCVRKAYGHLGKFFQCLSLVFFCADEMHMARQKSRADAEFYKLQQQAKANALLLTPEYLELKKYELLSQNSKVYFGPDIPSMFINSDNRNNLERKETGPSPRVLSELPTILTRESIDANS